MAKKLFWVTMLLVLFGLVMLSSASSVQGERTFGSSYYYPRHQLLFGILPGLALMYLCTRIDYRFWKKISFFVLFAALAMLILVFVPGVGQNLHGAASWVTVLGYTFQPAEILKLALIIYLAAWFGSRDERVKNWAYGMVPLFTVLVFAGLLLVLQPDVGTLFIVVMIGLGVYFVAGASMKHLGILALVGTIAFAGIVAVAPYRLNRVKSFLNPAESPRGISYQLNQSLIAIGSGGLFGVGFGKSTQKLGQFLPEAVGDSVFAIITEEFGFVGSAITLGLFLALGLMLIHIAKEAPDKFGRLLVMGVAVWVMVQALVNVAAVSGVGPITGVPLPLISYGGTATASLLAGLGMVMNVARRV